MSCMSAYSMPLCTIFTKCPAPSGPTCVVHGTPSTFAAIASSIGPRALPRFGRAARHDRRAVERALLASGHAHADEVDALLPQRGLAAAGVDEVRVAAVDDHVARLK